jgi:hypothetical protein
LLQILYEPEFLGLKDYDDALRKFCSSTNAKNPRSNKFVHILNSTFVHEIPKKTNQKTHSG